LKQATDVANDPQVKKILHGRGAGEIPDQRRQEGLWSILSSS
jgi:hypothetical protein